MRKAMLLLCIFLAVATVKAGELEYTVTVKENGESLVIISINGTGIYTVPIQDDVAEMKVKGALYNIDNQSAQVAVGSAGRAIILYKTQMLTAKQKNIWVLAMNTSNTSRVTLNLPKQATIMTTSPRAFISGEDYKEITMEGNVQRVEVMYQFASQALPLLDAMNQAETLDAAGNQAGTIQTYKENKLASSKGFLATGAAAALAATSATIIIRKKRKKTSGNKENIMKTLPKNEEVIINLMLENGNSMKRSNIERKSKIAKSSLASSLQNLEKKKIVEVDRTCTAHFVRLTKWFEGL